MLRDYLKAMTDADNLHVYAT